MADDAADLVNQFNQFLDFLANPNGGTDVILVKIVLSILSILLALYVMRRFILQRWEGIVAATDASWDDRIFNPLRVRIYAFMVIGGLNISVIWINTQSPDLTETTAPLFNSSFIILASTLASIAVKFILPEILNRFQRQSAVTVSGGNPLLVFLLRAIIWFGGLYLALSELGIDLLGVMAGLAVFSLIIGLAIQQTLGNIVNSFMLALDRPFEVGDRIEVDGVMQ